ncbi:T6SS AAA+ chaperone ClpV (TssH) [Cupriavidus sp. U2]|uniref:type VI secretion system ATPase TssH n=1 Tax=Cupriavidus sp. U2 TaxID=2920269 RepID=UPI00129EEDAC|nr:type VI secretion system ATPase TssH [Cupriavidus sp. U2]KAI3589514.1 T6SS AAA+ chaperone ClpV (TssH) [Cupriavidus sp. U2]
MTSRDYTPFLRRLDELSAQALTEAACLCETRAHRNIEVEHWLIALLEPGDNDLPRVLRRHGVNVDAIRNGLLDYIERLPCDLRGKPGVSARLGRWMEAAWLRASLDGSSSLGTIHLLSALSEHPSLLRAPDAWPLLTAPIAHIDNCLPNLAVSSASTEDIAPRAPAVDQPGQQEALARFTMDLTRKARDGQIDPVFGREAEIRLMIEILARRRKNNPILVGEPGVGKTALVEGLALRIANGDVPAAIRDVAVLALDLGLLQAGAGVKGEFEHRLRSVIDAVQQSPTPILLFIDEAHTLIGAGNNAGAADAANLLKPALARGELRTIAATTWSEYKQYFERDAALERRFQMVKVDEPDDDNACVMLRGLKDRYARHHGVHITDAAVGAAVRLSRRYLSGRQLPDKAVDLIDTAAARVRMSQQSTPAPLQACDAERSSLELERAALHDDHAMTGSGDAARLASIDARLAELDSLKAELGDAYTGQRLAADALATLREQWRVATGTSTRSQLVPGMQAARARLVQDSSKPLIHAEVDEQAIAQVIADWTGVPMDTLLSGEGATLLDIEARLGRIVVGQHEALAALGKSLRAAKAGLRSETSPLGVFLLVGPSGVGKTETARALADLMFAGERSLITINLSEYQEAHTVSQLKGSPPGYVGYGEGGVLTEAVRQRPYSVILLDEVEKAHRDVLTLFYQVFDRGCMRDGEGREIDFRNTVIIMTSNLGSEDILAATQTCSEADSEPDGAALLARLRPVLVRHFQPALLARFQTIVFRPLSAEAMASIVRMKLDKVARRVERRFGVPLHCDEELAKELVRACLLPDSGARNIDSLLDQQILPVLARELLMHADTRQRLQAVRLSFSEEDGIGIAFDTSETAPSTTGTPT